MKRGKKLLSVGVSLALLSTQLMSAALAAGNDYQDTKGHWAQSAIDRWSGYGIVQGYNGSFEPEASITRAQMAAILSRTLGLSETKGNPFSDVASDAWYAEDVSKCYAAGILQGSDGKANPESQVTRAEAMTMLCRALNIAPESNPDLASYADAGEVESWAAPYVAALIDSGAVSGVGENRLAPTESMSRAALVTVLDRAIAQYIPESGTYTMTTTPGLIVVAAGDVTLTGKTSDSVLITAGADGETVSFVDAVITGAVTVQADNASVTTTNATLPTPTLLGANTTVGDAAPSTSNTNATATTTKTTSSGGSSSSSSSSDDDSSSSSSHKKSTQTTQATQANEISESLTGGTYENVTIAAALGDGDITLDGVTITGDLTVEGGGSNSIHLNKCTIGGTVIMNKAEGSETPRLELAGTAIKEIDVLHPAILEAKDTASKISSVVAEDNVTIQGQNTDITTLTVPQEAKAVTVAVNEGKVATLEAQAPTTITGKTENAIEKVEASASVTASATVVKEVVVQAEDIKVALDGDSAVSLSVASGVATAKVTVTATNPDSITQTDETENRVEVTKAEATAPSEGEDDKKDETGEDDKKDETGESGDDKKDETGEDDKKDETGESGDDKKDETGEDDKKDETGESGDDKKDETGESGDDKKDETGESGDDKKDETVESGDDKKDETGESGDDKKDDQSQTSTDSEKKDDQSASGETTPAADTTTQSNGGEG
jgi:hypothetical protein